MKGVLVLWLCLVSLSCQADQLAAKAAQPAQLVTLPNLPARSTVVFLGDSITWQNLYPPLIESYFTRRYPQKELRFENRGLRGDTVPGALARFERDVVPLTPALILVLLGMNDGGYKGYNRGLLRFYLSNLESLVALIRQRTHAALILATPTAVEPLDHNKKEYNRMLAAMSEGTIELGRRLNVPVIDLFSFFQGELEKARAANPPAPLMLDPIHPGPPGQLLIARRLIEFLDPGSRPRPPTVVTLKQGERTFQLTHPHDNLYLPVAARGGAEAAEFQARFNQHLLVIKGLDHPMKIRLGETDLGVFSPGQLAAGVDLNLLDRAPWVRDAVKLYDLIQERWRYSYYLWDPEQRGLEALADVNPSGTPLQEVSQEAARTILDKISKEIAAFQNPGPGSYIVTVEGTP